MHKRTYASATNLALALILALALAPAALAEAPLGLALHPAGLTLSVRAVERVGDDMSVGVVATNNGQRTLYLLDGRAYLQDGQGREYPLRPPADGSRMGVPTLSRLRADLIFAGAPPLEDQRLVLVLNQGVPGGDSADTEAPFISVEIPLPRDAFTPQVSAPAAPADPAMAGPQVDAPAAPAAPSVPAQQNP